MQHPLLLYNKTNTFSIKVCKKRYMCASIQLIDHPISIWSRFKSFVSNSHLTYMLCAMVTTVTGYSSPKCIKCFHGIKAELSPMDTRCCCWFWLTSSISSPTVAFFPAGRKTWCNAGATWNRRSKSDSDTMTSSPGIRITDIYQKRSQWKVQFPLEYKLWMSLSAHCKMYRSRFGLTTLQTII